MKNICSNTCIVTSRQDLEHLYTFKNFPVFMGCTEQPFESDLVADMEWCISKETGCIQLSSLIPLEILYPQSRGSGTVGKLWLEHHRQFADFILEFNVDSILEIGGGHGTLSREFRDRRQMLLKNNMQENWTILEPNPRPASGVTAKYIEGFFNKNFVTSDYSAVVLSHVLEHLYDPMDFLRALSTSIAPDGFVFIAIPNFQAWLERHEMYSLHFEHHYLLLDEYIRYMFAKNGFDLVANRQFKNDHSLFYAFKKVTEPCQNVSAHFPAAYSANKENYLKFVENYQNKVEELNNVLNETNKPVYLFCVHAINQYLLALGLNTSKIIKILDNDPCKHGKRFYGTLFMIDSPKCLETVENPIVILGNTYFTEEIKRDILENINPTTEFLS